MKLISRCLPFSRAPAKRDGRHSPLYVILPYFNYCRFQRRRELFLEFVERYRLEPGVRLVVVEAVERGQPPQLPCLSERAFLHIDVAISDRVWIKENLINVAVRQLPRDWRFVAWVDADITFLDASWAHETVRRLRQADVVQMFQTAINLGPRGEALRIDRGFVHMHRDSGRPYHREAKYGAWHPGYAWACTRAAYERMGGLLDLGILGSGDRHMALAWIGRGRDSFPGGIHEGYKRGVAAFEARASGMTLDYLPGTIVHHFHGSLADRRYASRWDILVRHAFDPETDAAYDACGVLQLAGQGRRLQPDLDAYFLGRNEDGGVA